MKKLLISSIVVLIVTTIRHFIFKINKPKKDKDDPNIQKVPDTIAIASWVIFIVMLTVMLIFSLLFLNALIHIPKTQNDTNLAFGTFIFGTLSLVIFLYMRLIAMHTTYAEYSDHLILTVRTKKTRINYSDIQKFYFSDQKFVIIDKNRQKVKINLVWFRPRILFQTLVDNVNKGDFDHLSDYDIYQFLLDLARLRKQY